MGRIVKFLKIIRDSDAELVMHHLMLLLGLGLDLDLVWERLRINMILVKGREMR